MENTISIPEWKMKLLEDTISELQKGNHNIDLHSRIMRLISNEETQFDEIKNNENRHLGKLLNILFFSRTLFNQDKNELEDIFNKCQNHFDGSWYANISEENPMEILHLVGNEEVEVKAYGYTLVAHSSYLHDENKKFINYIHLCRPKTIKDKN